MTETRASFVVYDEAAFHQGAPAFTARRLNAHDSGTHIGIYMSWIILNRLESFALRQLAPGPVEEVRSKQLTGRDFLFLHCDGKLTSDALNKEGRSFTDYYYVELYLRDFDEVLTNKASGSYTVADSWSNFERMAAVMDVRLRDFRGMKASAAVS